MRILELGKFYPPHYGGIETLLRSWCEGFVRRGAHVDCVAANDRASAVGEVINGVHVHRLATYGTLFSTSICPGYVRSTRRLPADIWHAHSPNPLADLACLHGPSDAPLVISYHSDVVRQSMLAPFYRPLMNRVLARAQRVVVATPLHIKYSPLLAHWTEKCVVIPFGINQARFAAGVELDARAQALRAEAGGQPIVLSVGRLVGYKGKRFLIEAMRNVPGHLWIVGTGPLAPELEAQARALGIADRVRFWGSVDDRQLPALLHACDVFVLSSITPNEAFGIVQVEAMACGKPVVSCDLRSGVPFVNQHGVTGLVVPPGDSPALAEALKKLLANAELRVQMGAAGRARAAQEFAEETMIQRYWALFQDLVERRAAPRK